MQSALAYAELGTGYRTERARVWTGSVKGTLRAPLTPRLRYTIDAALRRGERQLVLDLSGLRDIDAAGVGELVRLFTAVSAAGGVLRIASARGYVRRVLETAAVYALLAGDAEG